MFPLRSDRRRHVFRHVDRSPGRRCLSAVAAMHVTPRTCPGPGDLWQPSWQEEKREAEYERLLERFLRSTSLATVTSGSINWLRLVRMNDILRLSLCLTDF